MNADEWSSQSASNFNDLLVQQQLPKYASRSRLMGIIRIHYRPRSEGDNAPGSIRPSVGMSVCALLLQPFDLRP